MEHEIYTTIIRLFLAVLAGGLIGIERTYHGRPAGFRTHTLVCTASSLLMLLAIFQWRLVMGAPLETIRVDPTRMAQGIMTGIGFLGAGVIIKERMAIRGLTTAASIWLTAAIGIVIGMGLYFAALLATLSALAVLIVFRWLEGVFPTLRYGRLVVRFASHDYMGEKALCDMIANHGIDHSRLSYQLEDERKIFQYQMTISTIDKNGFRNLSETLTGMENVLEFTLQPTGD